MGQFLAVNNEKLDKQNRIDEVLFDKVEELRTEFHAEADIIKKGCERDIRLIDVRLRTLEKKMWSIAGSLAVISVLVSPIGQRMVGALTGQTSSAIVNPK